MSPARHFTPVNILTLLDNLPIGIAAASPTGTLLHMNRALEQLLGITAKTAAGRPCRHVLRARPCVSGCPLGCNAFGNAAGAEAFTPQGGMESDLITFKQRKLPVRLTHFPLFDEAGNEAFRLDVVEDLTIVRALEQRLAQAAGGGRLIGKSRAMELLLSRLPIFAESAAPVLLTGETGTGKDLLAESLHQASPRAREPFVRVNISPMPEKMLSAELFGEDANGASKPGRFQQAMEGTLYLSELADIPLAIQTRLLHFLDSGCIQPVGAGREIKLNVRLITATNRDPEQLLRDGTLSPELFHRLNVVHIHLPPLRDRKEDLDFLLQHFLDLYAARFKKSLDGFDAQAKKMLGAHPYPGNIRELRNIVEYAAMVAPGGKIGVEFLPLHMAAQLAPGEPKRARSKKSNAEAV